METLRSEEDETDTSREAQLAALSRHLIERHEIEKAQLSRKLHNDLGAGLTVIALDISIVAEKLKEAAPDLSARLQRAITALKDTVALKRRIEEELRPGMLDSLGLPACLTQYAIEFEKRTGLIVNSDIALDAEDVDAKAAIGLFRIAQEALRNAELHADATQVWLALQAKDHGVCLSVEDDGMGIPQGMQENPQSFGLACMRERAALHQGRLAIACHGMRGGATIEAWLPNVQGVTPNAAAQEPD